MPHKSTVQKGLKATVIQAAVGSLGIRLAQAFAGVGITILLARMLGVEGVGTYAAIIAALQMSLIPIQSGVAPLISRQIIKLRIREDWQGIRGLITWSGIVTSCYAAVIGVILVVARPHSDVLQQLPVPLLLVGILAIAFGRVISGYNIGLRQVVIGQSFDLMRNVGILIATVSALYFTLDFDPVFAVGAFVSAGAAAAILLLIWAVRTTPSEIFVQKDLKIHSRDWMRMSLTFMTITGVMQMADLIGIILTRAYAGPAQAGLFQSSYQLSTLVLFGLGAITMAVSPYFAQMHEAGEVAKLAKLARRAAQGATVFAAAMAMLIITIGDIIMAFLYGSDFSEGQPILVIVTIAYLIQASTGASAPLLNACGYEGKLLRIAIASMVAGVATSATLIPIFGGIGTALGIVASMTILNIGTWWQCRRLIGIDTFFLPLPFLKVPTPKV